jgi:hypothetical protein
MKEMRKNKRRKAGIWWTIILLDPKAIEIVWRVTTNHKRQINTRGFPTLAQFSALPRPKVAIGHVHNYPPENGFQVLQLEQQTPNIRRGISGAMQDIPGHEELGRRKIGSPLRRPLQGDRVQVPGNLVPTA